MIVFVREFVDHSALNAYITERDARRAQRQQVAPVAEPVPA